MNQLTWLMYKYPINFILYIYHHLPIENYALKISKEINGTYSYITLLVKKFEEIGLIEKSRVNETKRINYLRLTDKGKKLAQYLDKLDRLLK